MKLLTLIKTFSLLAIAVIAVSCCNKKFPNGYNPDEQQLFVGDDIAIAQTQYGKIQGYICRDIFTFLGIPYGATTAGENRFMPPVAPEPWEGIKRTLFYGDSAPQNAPNFTDSYGTFRDHWNYGNISEDCLKLNVWTPALDGAKRPVIVWLHGGGWAYGNAVEQDGYKGENFARRQDAVFCSVNHRLNCFGFSDLASVGGEKYKHSGNVGMLDIIAALQWIHNNIETFGGDPNNVTIIGQSGGGSKVCTTTAMPAAKGLIHKAVALSGNSTQANSKEAAESLGEAILQEAGLTPAETDKLQQMPWQEYMEIANNAARKLNNGTTRGRVGFSPVADDIDIPSGTFYTLGRDDVPDIPMLLCSTTNEFTSSVGNAQLENSTRQEIIEKLNKYGENADAVFNAYAEIFPEETPFGIYSIISSTRDGVINTASMKLQQTSPVYVAWFKWYPPLFDNCLRAFHCLDICFWFDNTDYMITHTGGGKTPRLLSGKMADALEAFMRTGNPNTGKKRGLPEWKPYTVENGETMVLDNNSELKNAPDAKPRALLSK